jgi:hypothetical protein
MDQMKKVMGSEANFTEGKDGSGGKIMSAPGAYSAKNVPDVAKKVSYSYTRPVNTDGQAGS